MVVEQVVIGGRSRRARAGGNGEGLPRQHKRGAENVAPFPLHAGEGGVGGRCILRVK